MITMILTLTGFLSLNVGVFVVVYTAGFFVCLNSTAFEHRLLDVDLSGDVMNYLHLYVLEVWNHNT